MSGFIKGSFLSRRRFVERCAQGAFGLSLLPNLAAGSDPVSGPGFGKAKRIIFLQIFDGDG